MSESITVPQLLEVIRTEGLRENNFELVASHIILPKYHDAVWVALDKGLITINQVVKISDFVVNNPNFVPDIRVACLLYFLVGWSEYRKGNSFRARDGANRALDVSKNYRPAKKLLELIHKNVEPARIPTLTLNDEGRANPIEIDSEELEINPRWF